MSTLDELRRRYTPEARKRREAEERERVERARKAKEAQAAAMRDAALKKIAPPPPVAEPTSAALPPKGVHVFPEPPRPPTPRKIKPSGGGIDALKRAVMDKLSEGGLARGDILVVVGSEVHDALVRAMAEALPATADVDRLLGGSGPMRLFGVGVVHSPLLEPRDLVVVDRAAAGPYLP